jgi:hypothetical protein
MQERLDIMAQFGLPIWITEFDVVQEDEFRRAEEVEEFFRMAFSHPAVEGIMLWGFWAGAHWKGPNAALVDEDWTVNAAGEMFQALLAEWTTDTSARTSGAGVAAERVFHGDYEIEVTTRGGARYTTTTSLLPSASDKVVRFEVQIEEGFVLNAGLNDAWFNPLTAGQGLFVNVFPETGKVFLAMFTFDSTAPDGGSMASVGGPAQRWLTAIGDIDGNQVTMDVAYTTGGVFDSAEPGPTTVDGQGTLVLSFSDCASGQLAYDLPLAGLQGTIPLQRVVQDNVSLCEDLASGSVASARDSTLSVRSAEEPLSLGSGLNPGLNDAWFNPATAGQGVLINVFPNSNQLFLAKFTFDTARPDGANAVIGGPGQRWFTAIGPIEGTGATLDVAYTTGGRFDTLADGQQTATGQGTVTLSFESCAAATLDYDLPGAAVQGSISLQRVVQDNVSLCETLSASPTQHRE